MDKQILIVGSPVSGYRYCGPFADAESACAFAEANNESQDWWTTGIETIVVEPVSDDVGTEAVEILQTFIEAFNLELGPAYAVERGFPLIMAAFEKACSLMQRTQA